MAGCHDECLHVFQRSLRGAGIFQHMCRPTCTLRFVILCVRVVNGVVKPQREFDFGGMFAKMARTVELPETISDVKSVVIMPVRFGVMRNEFVKYPCRRGEFEFVPNCMPTHWRYQVCLAAVHMISTRTFAPSRASTVARAGGRD